TGAGARRIFHRALVHRQIAEALGREDVEIAVRPRGALRIWSGATGAGLPAEQLRRVEQCHVPLVGVGEDAPLHAVDGDERIVHRGGGRGGAAGGVPRLYFRFGDRRIVGGHGVVEQMVVLVDHPKIEAGGVARVVEHRGGIERAAAVGVTRGAVGGRLAAVGPVRVAVGGAIVVVVVEAGFDRRV